ncbi:nitroreductase family protein [Fusibacter bizertensis]|uniref:Nitroreductase family protein n=1 Tax=Fusibacter bizertensis TaxID=1488331 RepID=A0ABT6NAC7_9FIRM|nr:nitroreductase family protein [Fusibacter bizertensis]MDH8677376.1 nitroreductase family protein [Fusibacter bizertensis]
MKKSFDQAIEERRSYYAIGKNVDVTDETIKEIVEHAVKFVPSAFNSQTARAVVLLDGEHDKLWELTRESLRKVVPAEAFAPTSEKMDSFKAGYGTILYFEDQAIVEGLQQQFPLYKDNFPVWSEQSSGMLQFAIWTALEGEGLGASLQHYNEIIQSSVKETWKIPNNWKLIAQMPFGKPLAPVGEKEFAPLEDRVKIYK